MKKTKIDETLAEKWACSARTIHNWRTAGAPLDDDVAMRTWLTGRKSLPPATLALLSGQRRQERVASAERAAASNLPRGTPAALHRLEQMEARAFTALEEAMSRGDIFETKSNRDNWLKISESLRRYDLAVEKDRRESGQLIPRAEMERLVKAYGSCLRIGLHGALESLCPRVAGLGSPMEVWTVLKNAEIDLRRNLSVMLQTYPFEQQPIPAWLHKLADESFEPIPEPDADRKLRQDMFESFCAEFAKSRAEQQRGRQ